MTRKRFNKLIKAEMIQAVNALSKTHPSYRLANKVLYRLDHRTWRPGECWPLLSYQQIYEFWTYWGRLSICMNTENLEFNLWKDTRE